MSGTRIAGHAHTLCTFQLGAHRLCVDVSGVQEILRPRAIVPVPLAPPTVAGLINLRGQIVTAIDLGRLLDPDARAVDPAAAMILVVRVEDAAFGLLVDGIGDVLELDPDCGEPPPANLRGPARDLAVRAWKPDRSVLIEIDPTLAVRHATLDTERAPPSRTTGDPT